MMMIDVLELIDPELSEDFGDSFSDLSQYVLHYPDCPVLGAITNLKSLFITTFYVFCCHNDVFFHILNFCCDRLHLQ
jgi:hypothetical protein